MAEELNTNGASNDPAKAESQTVNAEAQQANTQESGKPVNLYDLPDFKNYQRNMDRQMAQLRQQAAQAQAQVNQVVTANMDDFQRAQYERDQAVAEVNRLRGEVENNLLLQQRFERISALSLKTGVPIEELNKAETPDDLAFLVADYKEKTLAEQVRERTAKAKAKDEANKVDVGGGGTKANPNDMDSRYKAAKGDPVALARLLVRHKED